MNRHWNEKSSVEYFIDGKLDRNEASLEGYAIGLRRNSTDTPSKGYNHQTCIPSNGYAIERRFGAEMSLKGYAIQQFRTERRCRPTEISLDGEISSNGYVVGQTFHSMEASWNVFEIEPTCR